MVSRDVTSDRHPFGLSNSTVSSKTTRAADDSRTTVCVGYTDSTISSSSSRLITKKRVPVIYNSSLSVSVES